MTTRHARGFTLIEVLVATALLAAGLALAFATLRAATATVERGEVLVASSERIRAVQGFLRSRLASAHALTFEHDLAGPDPVYFIGGRDHMLFVSDVPPYLGHGGPALHEVVAARDRDGLRLEVSFATVLAGQVFRDEPARPPELLAGQLANVRFSYRGPDAQGGMTDWLDEWPDPQRLPLLVRIEVEGEREGAWPTLVVAPFQAQGQGYPGGRRR
ncbi:prepilin-type N-terminal cleavage/methylation domain-containing protein [Luteimonas sp. A478]